MKAPTTRIFSIRLNIKTIKFYRRLAKARKVKYHSLMREVLNIGAGFTRTSNETSQVVKVPWVKL